MEYGVDEEARCYGGSGSGNVIVFAVTLVKINTFSVTVCCTCFPYSLTK